MSAISRWESADGRHVALYPSREQLATPAKVQLPEPEPAPGLLLPSGDINWGCPCLGSMAAGPCALPFRDAFACFHYSTADPKGSECYDKFSVMQQCLSKHPELYGDDDVELPDTQAEVSNQTETKHSTTESNKINQ